MNMNLNTQQLVLLCLLVAFVTSISTGITVVSLMDQSDVPVTQTINRVVERTIERVVEPEEGDNKTVTQTPERIIETVVVNQEDLTVEAVQKNSRSLIRIHSGKINTEENNLVTLGVAISGNSILANKNLIQEKGDYYAKTQMGEINLDVLSYDESQDFVILQLAEGKTGLQSATWADSNSLQLAQTIISISGAQQNTVSTGIVTKLDSFEKSEGENTWTEVTAIYTGVDVSNVLSGSIITNLQGNIVGFKNNDPSVAQTTFLPSNKVKSFLDSRGI